LRTIPGNVACVERGSDLSDWDAWELGRVVLVAAAVMYAGIWAQVTLFHWGAAFASRAMWAPVIMTPLIVVAAALAVFTRQDPWGWIVAIALGIGVFDGLYGLYRHLRGTISQIGGFTLRNLMAGPPPVLPLAYSLIGIVGLLGLLWDA
jgi:hypothetical protein